MPRPYNRGTPEERFVARVERTEGCWNWQGYRLLRRGHSNGPGRFAITPKHLVLAHRFGYELWVGPIPEGMVVHHRCENQSCVNPEHLELKPHGQHVRDHAVERGVVRNQYGTFPVHQ